METDSVRVNIGLEEREKICNMLHRLLASSYALYLKTQNFHWNVTGPQFQTFHLLFQSQYEELAEAVDEMAERVRALGYFPEGSFTAFAKLSLIADQEGRPAAMKMIEILLADHETLICEMRKNLPFIEKLEDGATADFINKRLAFHEKTAWIFRSILS